MKVTFLEPKRASYIHVDQQTNQVYVLMPVVSGTQIGLDNTCKSVFSLQEFFGKNAERPGQKKTLRNELEAYQKALKFDLSLIGNETDVKVKKRERLEQIEKYIEIYDAVQKTELLDELAPKEDFPRYPKALQQIMGGKESNLHSMVLRPAIMDDVLRAVSPVFSVNRSNTSVFSKLLQEFCAEIPVQRGLKAQIVTSVLNSLGLDDQKIISEPELKNIQDTLAKVIKEKMSLDFNFQKKPRGEEIKKEDIEAVIPAPRPTECIECLLNLCANNLFDAIDESPFFSIKSAAKWSETTQFFLGAANIFCYSQGLCTSNFGEVLDKSFELSHQLATTLVSSVNKGMAAEDVLLGFINTHAMQFGLTEKLTLEALKLIHNLFKECYSEIKGTEHFDEFVILDRSRSGPFFHYQGSISINFTEFVKLGLPALESEFMESNCRQFKAIKAQIAHNNNWVEDSVELSVKALDELITDNDQLNKIFTELSVEDQQEMMSSPKIQKLREPLFLYNIARGEQNEAEKLLQEIRDPKFLLRKGTFTDYSGRTFTCSAYEYAYWAKDINMCLMLERHMDDATRLEVSRLCQEIEKNGLSYQKNGVTVSGSKHFDFAPLIKSLESFIKQSQKGNFFFAKNWDKIDAKWDEVGECQRALPAHVIHEYCRIDRSFNPVPTFDEADLPRTMLYKAQSSKSQSWFPLNQDHRDVLSRGRRDAKKGAVSEGSPDYQSAEIDLKAIRKLDEVRTEQIKRVITRLKSPVDQHNTPRNR